VSSRTGWKFPQVHMLRRSSSQLSLLEPKYGWSEIPITRTCTLDLLSTFGVFPEVCKYLTAFGQKDFPRDESFAGFDSSVDFGSDGAPKSFGKFPIVHVSSRHTRVANRSICYRNLLPNQVRRGSRASPRGSESLVHSTCSRLSKGKLGHWKEYAHPYEAF